MTDRELLELAAKAAGIEVDHWRTDPMILKKDGYTTRWNPLTDDGDALRLAVKLRFSVECNNFGIAYVWRGSELIHTESYYYSGSDDERLVITRRAIVRAAAEIGKGMDHE